MNQKVDEEQESALPLQKPLESTANQLISFLFPGRERVDRFKIKSEQHASLSLWRHGKNRFLCYVTDQDLQERDIIHLLAFCEEAQAQLTVDASISSILFEVNLFAPRFENSFLSKLHFLSLRVKTYQWRLDQDGQKQTVLIQEILSPVLSAEPNGPPIAAKSMNLPENNLSAQEFSEIVQFGMDIRKFRESVSLS